MANRCPGRYGVVCPWPSFSHNDIIPIYRLVALGILVLALRRLPWVFGVHKLIPQIKEARQAIFVGFFGPIGVSAIFYLYIAVEFLNSLEVDGQPRADAQRLAETIRIVVWFLAICSIAVHGLSIPLGKLGFYLPRTLSQGVSTTSASEGGSTVPFRFGDRVSAFVTHRIPFRSNYGSSSTEPV